jgi:hypothetical protein
MTGLREQDDYLWAVDLRTDLPTYLHKRVNQFLVDEALDPFLREGAAIT